MGPSSEPAQAEARVDSSGAGKAGSNAGDDAAGQDPSRIAPVSPHDELAVACMTQTCHIQACVLSEHFRPITLVQS